MSKRKQLKALQVEALEDVVCYLSALEQMNYYINIRDWHEADRCEAEAKQIMGHMRELDERYHAHGNR